MLPKHQITEEGQHREEILHLLSDIFRILVKPVDRDSVRDLAPGELGMDYEEKCLYVRNPYTNEIITPNSLEYLQTILNKFNPEGDLLNADSVSGVRIYTSVEQLPQLQGIIFSVDTIIRQMACPSIFVGYMDGEDPGIVQIPCAYGILQVIKLSEASVVVRFSDGESCSIYTGKYDSVKHLFLGWIIEEGNGGATNPGVDYEDGNLVLHVPNKVEDLSVITIRIDNDLVGTELIDVNGIGFKPILTMDCKPIAETIPANSIIMLIRDETTDCWRLVTAGSTESVTVNNFILQIVGERTGDLQKQIDELREEIANLRRTNATNSFIPIFGTKTIDSSMIHEFQINGFDYTRDELILNLGQTILRKDMDYTLNRNVVTLNDITLRIDDIMHYTVLKSRSSIDGVSFIVSTYVVPENCPEYIPVPDLKVNDEMLIVNLHQTILRPDIDYELMEDGTIKLIGIKLLPDTVLHFTRVHARGGAPLLFFNDVYTVEEDDPSFIPVFGFDASKDILLVNLGQLILRKDIDFTTNSNGTISLNGISLEKGAVLQTSIIKGGF